MDIKVGQRYKNIKYFDYIYFDIIGINWIDDECEVKFNDGHLVKASLTSILTSINEGVCRLDMKWKARTAFKDWLND